MNTTSKFLCALFAATVGACNPAPTDTSAKTAVAKATHHERQQLGPETAVLRLIHDQDLDPAQERQLMAIRAKIREQSARVAEVVRGEEPALQQELARAAPNRAAVRVAVDRAFDAESEMAYAVADDVLALHATFSEQQRAQLRPRYLSRTAAAVVRADARVAFETGALAEPGTVATKPRSPQHMVSRLLARSDARRTRDHHRELGDALDRAAEPLLVELAKATPDREVVHALVAQVLATDRELALEEADRAIVTAK